MKRLPESLMALAALSGVRPSPGAGTRPALVRRHPLAPFDVPTLLRPRTDALRLLVAALLVTVASALADVHYVDLNSTNMTPPYTNWATAATNIQDAVDAAVAGDEVVVTNGTYTPVIVAKPLIVRSVNGPQFTRLDGHGFDRCADLASGSTLSGFTLSNGYSFDNGNGAGVMCQSGGAVVSNCVITGNGILGGSSPSVPSTNSGGGAYGVTLNNCTLSNNWIYGYYDAYTFGGGAAYCTLNNCILSGNSARGSYNNHYVSKAFGGGAYASTLNNCTLSGNGAGAYYLVSGNAALGGGAYASTLNNCTLTRNSAYVPQSAGAMCGGAYFCTLNSCIVYSNTIALDRGRVGESDLGFSLLDNCCVWPSNPLFVDFAGGDLRLQSNSPCINAGNNAYVTNATDLDGNPRIVGGTVDIGAYEFQSPVSQISYAWLQQYGLPINSSTDTSDPDGDAVDNYHEWLAGSDPTNPLSSPAQLTITASGTNVILTWSTNAVGFTLQSTTNMFSPAAWVTNSSAPVVIGGQNTVTNPLTGPQQFYRLVH